jgi:hypothetical protein
VGAGVVKRGLRSWGWIVWLIRRAVWSSGNMGERWYRRGRLGLGATFELRPMLPKGRYKGQAEESLRFPLSLMIGGLEGTGITGRLWFFCTVVLSSAFRVQYLLGLGSPICTTY